MSTNTTTNEEEWLEAWRWELFRCLADFLHTPDGQRQLRLRALAEAYARCHEQRLGTAKATHITDYHVGA
jgi:hypothetical protein